MTTLTIGDVTVPLTDDGTGLTATTEIDGERVRIYVTLTTVGRPAVSPAKAAFSR